MPLSSPRNKRLGLRTLLGTTAVAAALLVGGFTSPANASVSPTSMTVASAAASVSPMSASSCISSSAGDNGSDLFVLRYWHDLKNNCPETYRVQPQYQYYLGGTITNKWDSCQTLTSFASHRWTYEFNYVTGNGAKYMSNWRTC